MEEWSSGLCDALSIRQSASFRFSVRRLSVRYSYLIPPVVRLLPLTSKVAIPEARCCPSRGSRATIVESLIPGGKTDRLECINDLVCRSVKMREHSDTSERKPRTLSSAVNLPICRNHCSRRLRSVPALRISYLLRETWISKGWTAEGSSFYTVPERAREARPRPA